MSNSQKHQLQQHKKKYPIDNLVFIIITDLILNMNQRVQQSYYVLVALIINYMKRKKERKIGNIHKK
jgi:hypothetical protein